MLFTGSSLFATCDNIMRIYFDGVLQFQDSDWGTDTYQWVRTTELFIPYGTQVLGIECLDFGGARGILASTADGMLTDTSWVCTNNQALGGSAETGLGIWAEPDFEDTNGDFSTAYTDPKLGPTSAQSRPNIATAAQWIWADQNSKWSACKKRLSSGET